jgi:hypothetical protein
MPEPKLDQAPAPPVAPPAEGDGAPAGEHKAPPPDPAAPPQPAPALTISTSRLLRILLATLCVVISLTSITWAAIYKTQKIDGFRHTGELPFNEASKAAIELRISQSSDFLKVCILFLGGLVALIIAKRDEARIGLADRPETIMFICGTLALVGSWTWHELYVNGLSHYLLEGARTCFDNDKKCVPDVFNAPLDYLYRFQISFLVLGAVQTGITLVSAHRLKESRC